MASIVSMDRLRMAQSASRVSPPGMPMFCSLYAQAFSVDLLYNWRPLSAMKRDALEEAHRTMHACDREVLPFFEELYAHGTSPDNPVPDWYQLCRAGTCPWPSTGLCINAPLTCLPVATTFGRLKSLPSICRDCTYGICRAP